MRCPGVTWIRKIIRKLLVLYSLPPNPQRPLALSVSLSFCFSFSRRVARTYTKTTPPQGLAGFAIGSRCPRSQGLCPVVLCVSVAVCMQSVCPVCRPCSSTFVVPVARDKLVPAPATASRRGVSTTTPAIQVFKIHSVLLLMYGNEIVH